MASSQPAEGSSTGEKPRSISSTLSNPRTRRQAGLFFGGVAFVAFSALVTRRSLVRRSFNPAVSAIQQAAKAGAPISRGIKKPTPSGATPGYESAAAETAEAAAEDAQGVHGPILAVEALTLATLNVFSWAMMVTGGALWYFDISNMDEMRRKVRGGLGVDGTGRTEQEAEEDMEEWLAEVLARKEEKMRLRALRGELDELRNDRGRSR